MVGPYRIVRRWASGDTSHVYLARRSDSGTLVALKMLRAERSGIDEHRRRFEREGVLAQRVRHDHLVETHEVVDEKGERAIVMELLQGETLHDVLGALHPHRRMPAALALEITFRLAEALHHLHQLGAIHGDVCPANVMLTHDGRVKLLDFGGRCEGITTYAAPEQARGDAVDPRADVFGLGLVLFELLTGYRVRKGQGGSEIVADAIFGSIPSLSQLVVSDPELDEIVMRAVAQDPKDRYPTAEAFAQAIFAYRERVVPGLDLAGKLSDVMAETFGHRPHKGVSFETAEDRTSDETLGAFPPLGHADPGDAIEQVLRSGPRRDAFPFVEPLSQLPGASTGDLGWGAERTNSKLEALTPPQRRTWLAVIGVSLISSALMIAGSILFSGPKTRSLVLESKPPAAKVFLDGRLAGETPVELEIPEDERTRVVIDREGFQRLEIDVPPGDEPVHLLGALERKTKLPEN